ncbi:sodium/hydrogen exchanger [Lentinula detonsa]|uniref:Sodium/hydrogen exchanger n=1 Tax=Lentinula detonsa TaxID=2804962 RepID=A0A9W8NXI6_9AGAR|nr:sodium/hydrogen exchanger [Lentinula detonsa]KAJ3985359.1 sodium/hydrogen exchanger [Lentinula detonsa]
MALGLSVTAAAATPSPSQIIPEDEEYYSSWSLFLVCMLLILSLWTSYYLQIKRIRAVHETLVSIFAGMAVGLIVRLAPGTVIREMLTFKHTLFFNLLLPPIILNSGYELKQENFFRNFGSILTFAFLGTFISAVGVGVLVYIYSFLGLESLDITLLECLTFGSTLSATDPVTILAIFNQYKVDPKLYTVIFGESLLNDAVSIVMYETLTRFHGTEIYLSSIFHGVGIFLLSFSVSMALGVAFGLAMSLLLKHSSLNLYPRIESCLVALTAYTCYFFSNGLSMSGIVSLLFCGITLKHYAYHTMSRRTQRTTKYIFATLAQLSENFIFIYLGLALFTSAPTSEKVTSYVKPIFITITTIAVVFTRYAAVFPLSEAINFFHKHARGQRVEELPHSYQMMLFWAGLRGAVGVALAAGFQGNNANILRTTVLTVVVLTVLIFGGTTARMLEILGIRTGVEDEAASESDDEDGVMLGGTRLSRRSTSLNGGRWGRYSDDEPGYLSNTHTFAGRIGSHYTSHYNHHTSNPVPPISPFSASSESDSDAEVLPLASTSHDPPSPGNPPHSAPPHQTTFGEDGKWFQALDERYLLPLFSNATASRTFHARRARRSIGATGPNGSLGGSVIGTPADSEDEGEANQEMDLSRSATAAGVGVGANSDSRMERGLASPMLRSSTSSDSRSP